MYKLQLNIEYFFIIILGEGGKEGEMTKQNFTRKKDNNFLRYINLRLSYSRVKSFVHKSGKVITQRFAVYICIYENLYY